MLWGVGVYLLNFYSNRFYCVDAGFGGVQVHMHIKCVYIGRYVGFVFDLSEVVSVPCVCILI